MLNEFMRRYVTTYNGPAHVPSKLKSAFSLGVSGPNLIHGSLDSYESAVFAQLTRVPPTHTDRHTDRQTDHATCDVCSNRPYQSTACRRCTIYTELGARS